MRTDFISEIAGDTKGLWSPGIFAVESRTTGRRLYVGTTNVARRYRDHRKSLRGGVHENPQLQVDWSEHPDDFRFVLVQRVAIEQMINFVKQALIDLERQVHPLGPYNLKNAVALSQSDDSRTDVSPPPLLPDDLPIPTPLGAYERIREDLGDDAFDEGVWDRRLRQGPCGATTPLANRQEAAAKLLGGLPPAARDPSARADELIRRIHGLLGTSPGRS